jgi:hypothetical protein
VAIDPRKLRLYRLLKMKRILQARRDPAAFVEYAIPNEKTGKPLTNAPFHVEWHRFFSETTWGVISASVEHGKSIQIGVGRAIWEIGNNPQLRCLLIGANDDAARKALNSIRRHIDRNPRVREVFPELRRSGLPGDPWNDQNIRVAGASLSRDPTIQARSAESRNILGSRLDLVLIDDLLGIENTRTKAQRDKLELWFDDVVLTRVEDDWENQDYGRVFFIGNPWDSDDQMARLKARPGWDSITTSAVQNPDDDPSRWEPTWPAQWPRDRILMRRSGMLPVSFARKYLCVVLDDTSRRIKKKWVDHMFAQGKRRYLMTKQPTSFGRPLRCFTGLDPAVSEKDINAVSCLFTIAVDDRNRRIVVDCRSGRWTGPELLDNCVEVCTRFDSQLIVESNATQKWMQQFALERGVSARAFHTGSNKWNEEYGVDSLGIEMQAGLWVAPSGESGHDRPNELVEWSRELLDYDPSSHTGDRLMASWLAREGARQWSQPRSQRSTHLRR